MRTAWILPVAVGALAYAAPDLIEEDVPTYGDLKLTIPAIPEPTNIVLNFANVDEEKRDASWGDYPSHDYRPSNWGYGEEDEDDYDDEDDDYPDSYDEGETYGDIPLSYVPKYSSSISLNIPSGSKKSSAAASTSSSAIKSSSSVVKSSSAAASTDVTSSSPVASSVIKSSSAAASSSSKATEKSSSAAASSSSKATEKSSSVISKVSSKVSSRVSSGTGHISHKSSSKAITTSAPVVTTYITTIIYETTCPYTWTKTYNDETTTSTGITTSQTSTIKTITETVYPTQSNVQTLTYYRTTEIVTIYVTECPGTKTATEQGSAYTWTFPSSSTVTSTITNVVPYTTVVTVTPTETWETSKSGETSKAGESSKRAVETFKTGESSKPAVETSKAGESSRPAVETSKPVVESSKPAVYESSKAQENSKSTSPQSSKADLSSSEVKPVTYTTDSVYYTSSTITKVVTKPCSGTKTITSQGTTDISTYPTTSVETTTIITSVPVTKKCTKTTTPGVSSSKAIGSSSAAEVYSSSAAGPQSSAPDVYTRYPSESGPDYSFPAVTTTASSSKATASVTSTPSGYASSSFQKYSYSSSLSYSRSKPASSSAGDVSSIPVYESSASVYKASSSTGIVSSSRANDFSSAQASSSLAAPSSVPTSSGYAPISSTPVSVSCLSKPSNVHTKSRTRPGHSIGHCKGNTCTGTATGASSSFIKASGSSSGQAPSSKPFSSGRLPVSSASSSGFSVSILSKPSNIHTKSRTRPGHSIRHCTNSVCTSSATGQAPSSKTHQASSSASSHIKPSASSHVKSSTSSHSKSSASKTLHSHKASSSVSSYIESSHSRKASSSISSLIKSQTGVSSVQPTGTATSSRISSSIRASSASLSSSTKPYVCSTPSPESKCTRCQGQPGDDQWCGYDINSNYYEVIPKTCNTVEYNFTISGATIAPDGFPRYAMLVNGQFPGPLIEANWGDWIVVNVYNALTDNGTSIHFHGSRQNHTNEADGATSSTQCPIAPGQSYQYKFRAANYGSSWYHSHFALQAWDGVLGPMIIHGPASASYDVDAGALLLQDWSHKTIASQWDAASTVGPGNGPRTMDTGIINGKNLGPDGGSHYTLPSEFVPGKKYRLRIVNTAIEATFKFYIDGHKFDVIAADYTPITPYQTNIISLHPGQRYDIVVTADQVLAGEAPKSYWIRADIQNACLNTTPNPRAKDIKAIVNYEGSTATPTSTAYTYTDSCQDESYASLIPKLALNAGTLDEQISKTATIGANGGMFKWTLGGESFVSKWADPTLEAINVNGTYTDYAGGLQIQYPKLGEWVYIVIQSTQPLPHPIHFHGHDFFVVAQGTGSYNNQPLNLKNPPRRDTALMPWKPAGLTGPPSGGYLVLAWQTDNPGSWLMHCHIGWHAAMGFTLEIIEGDVDTIKKSVSNGCQLDNTCAAWKSYAAANSVKDLGT